MRSTLDLYRCTSTTLIALGLTLAACSSDPPPVVACGGTTGTLCNDGDACTFSGDCNVGSICNTTDDPYYDAAQGANVCVRLVCAADTDCKDGKTCTRERICQVPACQADSQCTGGTICSGGACVARPSAADVASCSVVTPDGAIRQGAKIALAAVARNANGVALPGIAFTWASSNAGAVAVEGAEATGGATGGAAELTAKVTDKMSVTCDRSVKLENFATLPGADARVVLITEDNGQPVADAAVTLFVSGSGMPLEARSAANGAASFAGVAGTIESVTVVKAGYEYVSVLAPGTKDVFLPIPRKADVTKAGGYRGAIDVSKSRRGDLYLGITAPAIPTNLLNLDFASILGDFINTTINAPQLGLNNQTVDLPGGVVFRLGNERFTEDVKAANLRCQGLTPGAEELGCYVSRAPAGPGIAWAIAGRLKLQDVASIAGKLSGALGGGTADLPIGDILSAVLPLLRTLNHGINAGLNTTEFPKVGKTSGMASAECADATTADYDDKCRGDFSKYAAVKLAADKPLAINAAITVPTLPRQSDGTYSDGVVVLSAAITGSRGLVPLGLTAGLDTTAKTQTADGKINGVDKPFGQFSMKLPDGQVPLTTAVPHSGIEGSKLALVGIALDPNSLGGDGGIQLSGLVHYVENFSDTGFGGAEFLAFPTGTFSVANASFTGMLPAGASVTRVEISNGDKTWLVYVPGSMGTITLPNVAQARTDLLSSTPEVFLQLVRSTTSFADVFTFGSGKNLDKAIELIEGFVIQECTAAATAACKIQ